MAPYEKSIFPGEMPGGPRETLADTIQLYSAPGWKGIHQVGLLRDWFTHHLQANCFKCSWTG